MYQLAGDYNLSKQSGRLQEQIVFRRILLMAKFMIKQTIDNNYNTNSEANLHNA